LPGEGRSEPKGPDDPHDPNDPRDPFRLPRVREGGWRLSYPFASRYLERPNGLLHYLDEGKGPTVCLLHGNPTWSFMWREPIKVLRRHFRALAPDHMGMGLSSRPAAQLRLKDRIDDIGAFLGETAPTGAIHLVGHDWGGAIALGWAVRNPERVASLTLINTGLRLPKDAKIPGAIKPFLGDPRLCRLLATRLGLFSSLLPDRATVRPMAKDAKDGMLAPYRTHLHRDAIAGFVLDIPVYPEHPSWDTLLSIGRGLKALSGVPALLIWGLRDFIFTRRFLEDMRGLLPQSRTLALPRSGHWPLEDNPKRIIPTLLAFLRRATTGPGAKAPGPG
jgi:haloalkane dehalogenase